jgi:ParB family chromosome partitioning protein
MKEATMDPGRDRTSRLGRGLSALMPNAATSVPGEAARTGVLTVAIEDVAPDREQPRRRFDEARIEELAASIRSKGVLQPILVRRDGPGYRIVAGERRWRAAQRAGLKNVPVLVKDVTERQAFELALIENIQREDLNAIEEAEAYRRLIDEHHLTQEACAERVGKDRSSIANALRLLKLPEEVRGAVVDGELDMGHARALLGLGDDDAIRKAASEVRRRKLSVRDTETLVRRLREPGSAPPRSRERKASPAVRSVEERLQRALGTKVRLTDRGGRGRIEIEYFSHEELERILSAIVDNGS